MLVDDNYETLFFDLFLLSFVTGEQTPILLQHQKGPIVVKLLLYQEAWVPREGPEVSPGRSPTPKASYSPTSGPTIRSHDRRPDINYHTRIIGRCACACAFTHETALSSRLHRRVGNSRNKKLFIVCFYTGGEITPSGCTLTYCTLCVSE